MMTMQAQMLQRGDKFKVYINLSKLVHKRSDSDLGNTHSTPRGGESGERESDCVLDRHGRRRRSQGGRMARARTTRSRSFSRSTSI